MSLKHLPVTSSTLNRLMEAKAELKRLTEVPRANTEIASRYALALLASMNREPHPNDQGLREVYKKQLVECLAGVEIAVLERMINPQTGLVSKLVHPPSIGEVNEWVEKARAPMMTRIGWQLDEIKRIELSDDKVISEEERERVSGGFAKLKQHLKSVGEKMRCRGAKAVGLEVKQVRDNDALLASLQNLEDARKLS